MEPILEFRKGILFVRLNGKLTKYHAKKFNNYLISVIMKHGVKYLVLNFNELISIDKYGIETINNIIYAIKNNDGLTHVLKNDLNLRFRSTIEINSELDVFGMVNI